MLMYNAVNAKHKTKFCTQIIQTNKSDNIIKVPKPDASKKSVSRKCNNGNENHTNPNTKTKNEIPLPRL